MRNADSSHVWNWYSRWITKKPWVIGGLGLLLGVIGGACSIQLYRNLRTNPAFFSFGRLAILGELTCLSAAIFTLPDLLATQEPTKALN